MQIAGTVADDLAAKDDETWGKDGAGRLGMHAEIAAAAAAMGSGNIGGAVAATVAGDLASDALVASGGNALAGNIAAGAAGALAGGAVGDAGGAMSGAMGRSERIRTTGSCIRKKRRRCGQGQMATKPKRTS
jgi:filamentous hemagglutinin